MRQAFTRLRKNIKLDDYDRRALTRFIDEFTTVSIHENTVGRVVAKIAQEVNKHHHTKTCRKHDTTCRFNYPRFPAPYTMIVEPCDANTSEEREELLVKYRAVLKKVKEVLEDVDVINRIMGKYDKQKETKAEYEKNRTKRIKELCEVAGVDYDTYIKNLKNWPLYCSEERLR